MAVAESEQLSAEDLAALNNRFEQSTPEEVLTWVKERFGAKAIQMSSFGLEDVALFDMVGIAKFMSSSGAFQGAQQETRAGPRLTDAHNFGRLTMQAQRAP